MIDLGNGRSEANGERRDVPYFFGEVLESVPDRVAEFISQKISIPTIGIGAGAGCDGQVLVTHDLLGLFDKFTPKFVKQYALLHKEIDSALRSYKAEVESGDFPGEEHSFSISEEEWKTFLDLTSES